MFLPPNKWTHIYNTLWAHPHNLSGPTCIFPMTGQSSKTPPVLLASSLRLVKAPKFLQFYMQVSNGTDQSSKIPPVLLSYSPRPVKPLQSNMQALQDLSRLQNPFSPICKFPRPAKSFTTPPVLLAG